MRRRIGTVTSDNYMGTRTVSFTLPPGMLWPEGETNVFVDPYELFNGGQRYRLRHPADAHRLLELVIARTRATTVEAEDFLRLALNTEEYLKNGFPLPFDLADEEIGALGFLIEVFPSGEGGENDEGLEIEGA